VLNSVFQDANRSIEFGERGVDGAEVVAELEGVQNAPSLTFSFLGETLVPSVYIWTRVRTGQVRLRLPHLCEFRKVPTSAF
jgi:hypothetical protein